MRRTSVASEANMEPSQGTEKEQTLAHRTALDEPDAPLSCSERHRTCSTARQCTVVPRSGRRGRRPNPVTSTRVPAGHPEGRGKEHSKGLPACVSLPGSPAFAWPVSQQSMSDRDYGAMGDAEPTVQGMTSEVHAFVDWLETGAVIYQIKMGDGRWTRWLVTRPGSIVTLICSWRQPRSMTSWAG